MQNLTPLPRCFRLLLAILSFALFLSDGHAAVVINVDINGTVTLNGQGAYSDPGNNLWNAFTMNGGFYNGRVSSFSSGALVDSTGASTGGVQLTFSGEWFRNFNYTTFNGGSLATGNAMMDDIIFVYPGEMVNPLGLQFTFSNLTPNAAYTLYLYGDAGKELKTTDFNVGGVTQTTTGRNTDFTGTYTLGADYVIYNTTADSSGNLNGYFTAHSGSTFGAFSGAQLIAVPEPQTWALAGLGGLAFILSHRIRQRRLIGRRF